MTSGPSTTAFSPFADRPPRGLGRRQFLAGVTGAGVLVAIPVRAQAVTVGAYGFGYRAGGY